MSDALRQMPRHVGLCGASFQATESSPAPRLWASLRWLLLSSSARARCRPHAMGIERLNPLNCAVTGWAFSFAPSSDETMHHTDTDDFLDLMSPLVQRVAALARERQGDAASR